MLMDAGAPRAVQRPRAGVSLDEPRAVMVSHFHADHPFGLAWLILGRALLNDQTPSLSVYGPRGTTSYLERLLDLAWGEEMRRMSWERLQLKVQELADGDTFQVDGSRGRAFKMQHASRLACLGFTIERDGVNLGYTGDAEMSPQLDALGSASDHVIIEMTYDDEGGELHLARKDIAAMMARHPSAGFILSNRGGASPSNRAAMA